MQDQQTAGIDLPLKALAWEDAAGRVWLTYNEIAPQGAGTGGGASSAVGTKR